MIPTPDQIKKHLVVNLDYKETQVDGVTEKILNIDPELLSSFFEWFESGVLPNTPLIEGFTPHNAFATYKLKPPAIFLLLDWIKRDSKSAFQALHEDFGITAPQT